MAQNQPQPGTTQIPRGEYEEIISFGTGNSAVGICDRRWCEWYGSEQAPQTAPADVSFEHPEFLAADGNLVAAGHRCTEVGVPEIDHEPERRDAG